MNGPTRRRIRDEFLPRAFPMHLPGDFPKDRPKKKKGQHGAEAAALVPSSGPPLRCAHALRPAGPPRVPFPMLMQVQWGGGASRSRESPTRTAMTGWAADASPRCLGPILVVV